MKISRWIWLIFNKEHIVSFAGKQTSITCKRFKKISEQPQAFVDRNGVICGACGRIMLPGSRLWLFQPNDEKVLLKPGILTLKDERGIWTVGCTGSDCIPTIAFMCGVLEENRKIRFFESIVEQAVRTNGPVIVQDIGKYGSEP